MRQLPLGIQSFEDLRNNGYKYIDKTEYLQNLVESGKVFFLMRPRRFGKSLLITTMEAYFEGKKDLFKGLQIEQYERRKAKPWQNYPVVHFGMAGGSYTSRDGLSNILADVIFTTAERYGIAHDAVEGGDLPVSFKKLIRQLKVKTGMQVVVLVDEYDKPLLENLGDHEDIETDNHLLLKSVFSVLKDMDGYLKFVFITGVTKFSKVSIFSDLNQLKDISLLPKYAAICGITEDELKTDLREYTDQLAVVQNLSSEDTLQMLARMYDGYHFSRSAEGVNNPFSLFNALSDGDFNRYWFGSATPTLLYKALMKSGRPVEEFSEGLSANEARISNYRADANDLVPLYYQSGYLTITGYDPKFRMYTLSYPNDEVKYGFLESLIPMANPVYHAPQDSFRADKMTEYLQSKDIDSFMKMLQALLASIPYYEGKTPEHEQQWRNIIFAVFTVLGQYVRAEVHSSTGRSDCIVENEKFVYIFEFKQDDSSEAALRQIEEKGYALPYASSAKQVVRIGVNFSTKMKTIDTWLAE